MADRTNRCPPLDRADRRDGRSRRSNGKTVKSRMHAWSQPPGKAMWLARPNRSARAPLVRGTLSSFHAISRWGAGDGASGGQVPGVGSLAPVSGKPPGAERPEDSKNAVGHDVHLKRRNREAQPTADQCQEPRTFLRVRRIAPMSGAYLRFHIVEHAAVLVE